MTTQHGNGTLSTSPAETLAACSVVGGSAVGRRPIVLPPTAEANPEMGTAPRRRVFSAKEKLRILEEADAAVASGISGAIGALLRQEGIYSSILATWRRQREQGNLSAKRGPKPPLEADLQAEIRKLRQENNRLQVHLTRAEQIIDLQKKVSDLLTIPLTSAELNGERH